MAKIANSSKNTTAGSAAAVRKAKAAAQAVATRRAERQRRWISWGAVAVAVVTLVAAGIVIVGGRDDRSATNSGIQKPGTSPLVGGDLHTVATIGDALYVAGHKAVAVSHDGGRVWQPIPSLQNADVMGWAITPDMILVGGHPGLFSSTDNGQTFSKITGAAAIPDVHALGGTGSTVYLASTQAGVLASIDAGRSWQVRNADAGRSFMGTILVDPKNSDRLIAPDMAGSLATSTDGGRTWKTLGGPTGAMAAAWDPTNTREIIAVGMNGAARSSDGGTTWQPATLPEGASALSYDVTGRTLYAGTLDGERARTYRSLDNGDTWSSTT